MGEFTGERFIPEIENEELTTEHMQRYISILPIVKGKKVVDIACGEGYGTNILAESALDIVGIDINKETVENASKKYRKNNLHYMVGSVADIPVKSNSVDVIVSYETIEHVDEESQKSFLKEAKRVLKKDGVLIISTPNKELYSDRYHYHNEFHIKEFYKQEFIEFIQSAFQHMQLYHQYDEVVNIIENTKDTKEALLFKNETREGKYYVVVASDGELPTIHQVVKVRTTEEYARCIARIVELQKAEEERNLHITKLDGEIAEKDNFITILQKEVVEKDSHITKKQENIKELRDKIEKLIYEIKMETELRVSIEKHKEELYDLIKEYRQQMDSFINCINEKNEKIERMIEEREQNKVQVVILEQKLAEVEAKNLAAEQREEEYNRISLSQKEEILKLNTLLQDKQKKLEELSEFQQEVLSNNQKQDEERKLLENKICEIEQEVRNKQGHIDLLLESDRELERLKTQMDKRLTMKIFPRASKRRLFAKLAIKGVKHPIKTVELISTKGKVKNFFRFLKKDGVLFVSQLVDDNYRGVAVKKQELLVTKVTEGKDISEYQPLTFEKQKKPQVSIVIPVYNQFDYTYNCLKSILNYSGTIPYEIIIANDCSTDLTTRITEVVKNIKVVTNQTNLRFLKNCNNAAKYAKGKYILFLNNDTQVQPNWLAPLVELIERDSSIGMVGSKLVYADGRLQEAGGIVWNDGSAWNYGNRKDPADPEFNYVKEADYISGAAIMIKTSLWKEIGGFDENFAPAYYEDTDLAFEVRKHGYKVMYQPLSVVVHFEGVSNGTDISSGQKAYQQVNAQKFFEKWKNVLQKEHYSNGQEVFKAKDRSRNKKHILVIDHYVPMYDKDAGNKCSFMYISLFVKLGYKVTFIGDNYFKHEPYATELNQMGVEILYGNYYYLNWKEWLKENAYNFDYVYMQRPHISEKYIDLLKQYSKAKIVYFGHDLHYLREYRQYQLEKDPAMLKSSNEWKKKEFDLFHKADIVYVVGSYEQQILQKEFPNKLIRNIPLYIYEGLKEDVNTKFQTRKDILFVGGFGHSPNRDAVLWFAQKIFPKVLKKYPDMKWYIVGSNPTEDILALKSENIIVKGFVSDEELAKLYSECRLAVVPLRVGAGVKGKVVEAVYHRIPLLTTPIGAEGLSTEEHAFLVSECNGGMANIINNLYESYNDLEKLSNNCKAFIENHFTIEIAERIIREDFN